MEVAGQAALRSFIGNIETIGLYKCDFGNLPKAKWRNMQILILGICLFMQKIIICHVGEYKR